jgi:hypothetical protein
MSLTVQAAHPSSVFHAATIQAQGMSETDQKTDQIARSRMFKIAAALLIGAAITGAVVLHAAFSLLLIPAVALGIYGTRLKVEVDGPITYTPQAPANAVKEPVFVEGQPVGIANPGSNCWVNAMLQMLANVPGWRHAITLAERLDLDQTGPFREFLEQYDTAQATQSFTTQADSGLIRQWLIQQNRAFSAGLHEDAIEGIDALTGYFQRVGRAELQFFELFNRGGSERGSVIGLGLEEREGQTLNSLMDQFFRNPVFGHRYFVDNPQQLREAPRNFCVQFKRFGHLGAGAQGHRIGSRVDVPMTYRLDARHTRNGMGAEYTCRFFIKHTGEINSGHYTAYVEKPDGWWECSDSRVTKISEEQAKEELCHSYFAHFTRDP